MPRFLSRLTTEAVAGRFAVLAGAVMAAGGAIYATRPEIQSERVSEPLEHTILVLLAGLLLLAIPPVIALGRRAGGRLGPRAAGVAAVGQIALAITCTASNINNGDPEWFIVAAPLANLLWLGGWVALAVALHRSGSVPRWIAIGLPLTWALLLPGSQFGLGLVAGAYWIALGTMMGVGTLARREPGSRLAQAS